jgi:hypothetical protein
VEKGLRQWRASREGVKAVDKVPKEVEKGLTR